eukprot:366480-Chlamydomonas_euryale.AAC.11
MEGWWKKRARRKRGGRGGQPACGWKGGRKRGQGGRAGGGAASLPAADADAVAWRDGTTT